MIDSIGATRRPADARPRRRAKFVSVAAAILASGCAIVGNAQPWVMPGAWPVKHLPGWPAETGAGLRSAIEAQCRGARIDEPWRQVCRDIERLDTRIANASGTHLSNTQDAIVKEWIARRFEAWPLTSPVGAARGILTGYYEPWVSGSRKRESASQVPLYAPPASLKRGERWATREQIESGAMAGALEGRELVWLDDPVDAFFLQIQGSGRVRLRDGDSIRVGFAAHNGHEYVSIGRALIRSGTIPASGMSAEGLKTWLRENPQAGRDLMRTNPRYVFFREMPGPATGPSASAGPPGSLGVPLTPMRSVATDASLLPPGALLYLDGRIGDGGPGSPRVGLAVSQDTGGAIKGEVRADLFTGTGQQAGAIASGMRAPLRMWLLWPKGSAPPRSLPVAFNDPVY